MAVLADRAEEIDGKSSVIGIFQAVTARRFWAEDELHAIIPLSAWLSD
jgi:hypothetical protein